jgi:two-component system heavy metal sensor histidine kinase CusS
MSSKNDRNGTSRRSWSLAARLTAYYAGSAFLIVSLATGYLYWAMVRNVNLEDDRVLADRVQLLQTILQSQPLDREAIQQEVDEAWQARQHTQIYIRMLAADGTPITQSPSMEEVLPPQAFPLPVDEPGTGLNVLSTQGRTMRVVAVKARAAERWSDPPVAPSGAAATIQVALDRSPEDEIIQEYREQLAYVLLVAFIICVAAGHHIARRGMQPIHDVTRTARETGPGNLAHRITTAGLPAELHELAGTFNAMLNRLEDAFNRLSRFSADIAHELRTPVNNLRGELDVALQKPRSAAEYQEIIGSALEECGRLARIIDSLLFLARSENPQTQVELEQFDVAAELRHIREFYEATAEDAGIELIAAPADPLETSLNRALFQRALGNLITNAIAHTPRGGKVTLRANGDSKNVAVEVADTGAGIPSEHLPHVFDRFYRADHSRAAPRGGVGLGLAIVKSIVELHGGSVSLASEVGRGTRVRLEIPRNGMHGADEMTKP